MRTLPDIENLLEPVERAIADVLIPSLTEHNCSVAERKLLALPAHMGGLGMTNPTESAESEYSAAIKMSAPLVDKIMAQSHETPDDADVRRLVHAVRKDKDDDLEGKLDEPKVSLPVTTQRAVDLACEKGTSSWLTAIPLKDMNFDLSKREFRDWPIPDSPSVGVCGCSFTVDHAMICQRGGLVIQQHNEIRDLEAELLDMVCYDVAIEPTLQPLAGEELNRAGEQIQHQMHVSMCTVVDSVRDNGPPFWIYGYVTRMRTRTKSLAPNRYINCTKTKRSGSMLLE